jgi:hypothetical protein
MNNTLMKKLLPILVILIFILQCDGGNKTITFYENEDYLIPFEIIVYEDNTIIFHLVKYLNNSTPCFEPRLTFRILYSNGTSNLITIHNHGIPPYNFCDKMLSVVDTIPGYILVIYIKFTDVFGMMIEWNGNVRR